MADALPKNFVVRRPTMDDLQAVYSLILANDLVDFGEPDYSEGELLADWQDIHLETDAWIVVTPGSKLVGYAGVSHRWHTRMDTEVYVHPEHVGKGIGAYLIRLTEARAREHVPLAPPDSRVVLNNAINGANDAACRLLERKGYAPVRYFHRMAIELEKPPPEPEWPTGITVRPCVPGRDERAIFEVVEEAFQDHWGYMPKTFETWERRRKGETFDPELWLLAVGDGEIAGVVVCNYFLDGGWVEELAVRRPWRRQGLGMTLLLAAFGEFYRRGRRKITLGVDSENLTGATRLYERAGMRADRRYAVYQKELRPGRG
jgi:mycothiol synthase